MGKDIFYLLIPLLIIFLVGGAIFFFTQQRQEQSPRLPSPAPVQTPQEEEGLGSQLYENPAAGVPEANPLEGYNNPFE